MASAERTSSRKRCKNGTRRNKKTGECVKVTSKKTTSTRSKPRCKNGTRRNKETGECEKVNGKNKKTSVRGLDSTCAICLEEITSENIQTQCKHNFHKECLLEWCETQRNKSVTKCPICRRDISNTCRRIMPVVSKNVFKYLRDFRHARTNLERSEYFNIIATMIVDSRFDVNVEANDGESLLYKLSSDKRLTEYYIPLIQLLLWHPDTKIKDDEMRALINQGNVKVLAVYRENIRKVPKQLRKLF
jgi:hypothetical protein